MRTYVRTSLFLAAAAALALSAGVAGAATAKDENIGRKAPSFPDQKPKSWIGTPVSWKDLRGKVVMVDVWAFMCPNCQRTAPWIKEVRAKYGEQGFAVVGIHTPEFEQERDPAKVSAAVQKHGLDYPHFMDNDQVYWTALHVEAWPTTFLVDRCGKVRLRHVGEIHSDDESGKELEQTIQALLAEKECAG
jgi:thiol-disulfide isomerase/thioredoxin